MIVAVTASGRIEPAARVGLTLQTPGRVAEVFVVEGDRVAAGDPLARADTDQLELQVAQSQATLAAAESQLAQLEAGPRQKEIEQARANLRAAEAQWNAAVANRNRLAAGPTAAEIEAAEAQVAQANTSKEIAQDSYDLIDDDGTEKEQANYDLYTAKQELAAAEARLQDTLAGPSGAELRATEANAAAALAQRDAAQAQLDKLLAGATEEEIAEAEAQVEQARAGLKLAEHALERATLRAPFEGFVTEINVTAGEVPPTRQQPFVLVDNTSFHMTVTVDELDISGIDEGQSVETTIEALPSVTVPGTVHSIAPVSTVDTGVIAYQVVIDLDPGDAPLRADMTANARIIVDELDDVLTIPSWVVRVDRDTGETFVHRRSDEEIERVEVELGVRHEGRSQVVSGLSAGDEIVRLDDDSSFGFGSGQRFGN
jgi:HlyD family secretion protein